MKGNKSMKNTVHYFCFGVDDRIKDKLKHFPSAQPKIRYIIDTIKKNGYKINMVSSCSIKNVGFFKGGSNSIDDQEKHTYFSSFKTPFQLLNKLSVLFSYIQLILYMLIFVKKNDLVVVYHSIYYVRPMRIVRKIKHIKLILEVEEIYSFLNEKNRKFKVEEIDLINSASAYILVNDLIDEKISRGNKQAVISYGNYSVPSLLNYENFKYEKYINVVYAGVIENIRKAAFMAIESARYLNNNFRIHILGFGNEEDVSNLQKQIKQINTDLGTEMVIFHGSMSGHQYYKFLQACDIALSCHIYDESMLESADYTFPSKIITYLANGLSVVSTDIRSVRSSELGKYISFYSKNSPKEMANTILSLSNVTQNNMREVIKKLDKQFIIDLKEILEGSK